MSEMHLIVTLTAEAEVTHPDPEPDKVKAEE